MTDGAGLGDDEAKGACASEEVILAFVENRLGAQERGQFTSHLAACGACSELLAAATTAWFPRAAFAAVNDPAPRFAAGARFGPYVVVAFAGRGSMGEVYRAHDSRFARDVAIKMLPARFTDDPERLARFLREARAIGGVAHPNTLTPFDLNTHDGIQYLVTEWLEGTTLRDRLALGAMPTKEVLRVGVQLANGLAAAHAKGVIHRDLKPANLFLCADGVAKILDFGLARLVEDLDDGAGTQAGAVLGTAGYMAPEQVRGEAVDERADLFALGAVLYEMVTGRPAFGEGRSVERMSATLRDEPPIVSGEIGAVIARCLAKDPAQRFRSAHDLAFHLIELEARRDERAALRNEDASKLANQQPSSDTPVERRSPLGLSAIPVVFPGAAVIAPASGGTRSLRDRSRWLIAAMAFAAAALVVVTQHRRITSSQHALDVAMPSAKASPGGAASPSRPGCMIELPLPTSSSAGAITAYKSAIQSFHDSHWGQAELSLREAIRLDPELGIAHLRLAIITSFYDCTSPEAKASYREAMRLRGSLSPRDLGLLDALEPLLNADTADLAEAQRRLHELSERLPLDAELSTLLGFSRAWEGPEGQLESTERAVALDPDYADAWSAVAAALADRDPAASIRALDQCLSIAPTASDCRMMRAKLESALGHCNVAEQQIRRATDDPHTSEYMFQLRATVLYALGEPIEAVTEALRQRWARLEAHSAPEDTLYDKAMVAIAYGDFETARSKAEEALALVGTHAPLRPHARILLLLSEIEIETGNLKAAATIASSFLARKSAWQRGLPIDDPTVYLTRVMGQAGRLSEREVRSRRDTWFEGAMASVKQQRSLHRRVWQLAYVEGIERQEEAEEALTARPEGDRADAIEASLGRAVDAIEASLGRVLALAGKSGEALPYLERAHRRCDRFNWIVSAMRSDLLYGDVLAKRGDRADACEVYRSILRHWGDARPPSVTAARARARSAALGCAVPAGGGLAPHVVKRPPSRHLASSAGANVPDVDIALNTIAAVPTTAPTATAITTLTATAIESTPATAIATAAAASSKTKDSVWQDRK